MDKHEHTPPVEFVLAKHTFWGCFLAYRDQIAYERGWNSDTLKAYESSILHKIVRNIPNHNHKPLSALTKADFVAALAAIRKEGYVADNGTVSRYDDDTIDRFWYLMEVVTEAAEKNYLCRNVLSHASFDSVSKRKNSPSSTVWDK